jgi:hypothetical protein
MTTKKSLGMNSKQATNKAVLDCQVGFFTGVLLFLPRLVPKRFEIQNGRMWGNLGDLH